MTKADLSPLFASVFRACAETDVAGTTRAVLHAMVEATGADRGFVMLVGEHGVQEPPFAQRVAHDLALPEAERPSSKVLELARTSGEPVRIRNALEDPALLGRPSVLGMSIHSVLCVPIAGPAGRPVALVYLDSIRLEGIFSEDDAEAARRLADACAPALQIAGRLAEAEQRASEWRERCRELAGGPEILGESAALRAACERMLQAATSGAPILLRGETGTGKELFARAIHHGSSRRDGPFVAVNCGALPEHILDVELFGCARGAFTDAIADRPGLVEAASGGTLFLDEVGDMPLQLQVKLLRFLQEGELRRLGEVATRTADVRVVSATHRDVRALVDRGAFRKDLLYRLCVIEVCVPPLRERGDDVILLAEAFCRRYASESGRDVQGLAPSAQQALLDSPFPGNIRELQNAIRHAVVFAAGPRLEARDLPAQLLPGSDERPQGAHGGAADAPRTAKALRQAKRELGLRLERRFLADLLQRTGGNVSEAARLAEMKRTSLHELMARHGLNAGHFRDA